MTAIPSNEKKITIGETGYRGSPSKDHFRNVGANINALVDAVDDTLGTIQKSFLTESQYQQQKGSGWVLMHGQDITGSDLSNLTGITTLPNTVTTKSFMRQANDEGLLGNFEASTSKDHSHAMFWGSNAPPLISRGAIFELLDGSNTVVYATDPTLEPANRIGFSYFMARLDPSEVNTEPTIGGSSIEQNNTEGAEMRPTNISVNFFIKINIT